MPTHSYPLLPTKDLLTKFAAYNPRRLTESQFDSLRNSINQFGFVEPVIVNKTTNRIVGGHQRIRAAESLGISELPVYFVELDEPREKALNVALNKISGEWDTTLLSELLESLDSDLQELTGFNDAELKLLLSDPFEAGEEEKQPSVKESRYTTGQLRTLAHAIYPAQATVILDFLRMVDERDPEAS